MNERQPGPVRLLAWAMKHWSLVLAGVGALATQALGWLCTNEYRIAFFGEKHSQPPTYLVYCAVGSGLLTAFAGLMEFWRRRRLDVDLATAQKERDDERVRVRALEAERDEMAGTVTTNVRNLLNGYLLVIAQHDLELTSRERVSLYVHDGDAFHLVSRYSENPTWNKHSTRSYSPDAGVIGRAWQDRTVFLAGFPDPATDSEAYFKEHVATGLKPKLAKSLRMKSRLYYASRVDIDQPGAPKYFAVFVVESLDPARFTEQRLEDVFMRQRPYASRLLGDLEDHIPLPSVAAAVGL